MSLNSDVCYIRPVGLYLILHSDSNLHGPTTSTHMIESLVILILQYQSHYTQHLYITYLLHHINKFHTFVGQTYTDTIRNLIPLQLFQVIECNSGNDK